MFFCTLLKKKTLATNIFLFLFSDTRLMTTIKVRYFETFLKNFEQMDEATSVKKRFYPIERSWELGCHPRDSLYI